MWGPDDDQDIYLWVLANVTRNFKFEQHSVLINNLITTASRSDDKNWVDGFKFITCDNSIRCDKAICPSTWLGRFTYLLIKFGTSKSNFSERLYTVNEICDDIVL